MAEWDSRQYAKFLKERTQPSIDLAARITGVEPAEIIDIGCGPGNSTQVLKDRFPSAHTIGADNSENMIISAREKHPDLDFMTLDASGDMSALNGKFDVVFSNACIQWVPGHEQLLPKMFALLRCGGVMAVQIPMNCDEPIHQIIGRLTNGEKWGSRFPDPRIFYTKTQSEYFDILSGITDDFELWKTTYLHRMGSHDDIIEWYKGTGLRLYLAQLNEAEGAEFISELLAELKQAYPVQKNGEIIFAFPRFFFIARKNQQH